MRVSPARVAGHLVLWLLAGVAALLGVGSIVNGERLSSAMLLVASLLLILSSIAWKRLPFLPVWPVLGVGLALGGLALPPTQTAPVQAPAPKPVAAQPTAAITVTPFRTATPVNTPTPAPRKIGDTSVLTGNAGARLSVTVNAVDDNVPPGRSGAAPQGRYLVIDWTVKNDGPVDIDLNRLDFKVQTADGYVIQRSGSTVREPDLQTSKIGPGQIVRGWLTYDVPNGQRVTSAIYQTGSSRQFVIAELPR